MPSGMPGTWLNASLVFFEILLLKSESVNNSIVTFWGFGVYGIVKPIPLSLMKHANKGGRPPVPDSKKRKYAICIKFTADERRLIQPMKESYEFKGSDSDFIRFLFLMTPKRKT